MRLFRSNPKPPVTPDPKPLDGFKTILGVLFVWGVWPGKTKSVVYTIYRVILHLLVSVYYTVSLTIAGIGTVLIELQDLGNVNENMYTMFIGNYTYWIKMSNIIVRKKQIENLLDKMDKCLVLDTTGEEEKGLVSKGINTSRKTFNTIATTYVCIVLAASLKPFFAPEPILIFPGVFPFDWSANMVVIGFVYLYQFFGGMSQSLISACADSFAGVCLGTVGGYIDALGWNFEQLQYDENGKYEENEDKKLKKFRVLAVKYVNIME